MEVTEKSFKNWRAQEIEETFGIDRTWSSNILKSWLKADIQLTDRDLERLEELRYKAERNVDAWNEAALKFLFLGPLMSLVDFQSDKYGPFLEQSLTISNDLATARGNVDFMVATGRQIARAPYYVLHEYKQESANALDPQGQLLIAMLAAQRANAGKGYSIPIYGSYLLGRIWFMVVLVENEYTISEAYDCTQPGDIQTIFRCLHYVKQHIERLLNP